MNLLEKQELFAELISSLILWIVSHPGWKVTKADGSVDFRRKFRLTTGSTIVGDDAQHMPGSLHYQRLAQDLNLFIDGIWISDGGHPAWTEIGRHWEGLHGLCAWGGQFTHSDANHFSLEHEGRK